MSQPPVLNGPSSENNVPFKDAQPTQDPVRQLETHFVENTSKLSLDN